MTALKEIHRVLARHSALGLVWNVEDYNNARDHKASTAWEGKLHDLTWKVSEEVGDEESSRSERACTGVELPVATRIFAIALAALVVSPSSCGISAGERLLDRRFGLRREMGSFDAGLLLLLAASDLLLMPSPASVGGDFAVEAVLPCPSS